MQNKTILTILFLLVALASGQNVRNSRRLRNRRLMGPGDMEDMMTVEPDDEAEAEADAVGETDVCLASCDKWAGKPKYQPCVDECNGLPEPSDRRTRRNRRNRQLMMEGKMLMDEDTEGEKDGADTEADCCESNCEEQNPEAKKPAIISCVDLCVAAGTFASGC